MPRRYRQMVRTSKYGTILVAALGVLTRLVPETVSDLVGTPAPVRPATAPVAPSTSTLPTRSKSHWGWWVAGGTLVVAGGVAAAIVLMQGTSNNSMPPNNSGSKGTVPTL